MAYNVSSAFREQLYSGESNFRAILTIDGTSIDNDQIASISISSPIIDDSKQVFYVGTFISQKITIHFKDMNGIVVRSGSNVELSIGQYVNNEWVDVPIGKFIIDDLAEDYYKKSEINCLDYGVKFKPNIDYSPCFTDGKANVRTILEYICEKVGVELGDYPTINDEIEVGTYDSTVSGKQWVSYIAEIKGCNAKIDRTGKLTLQPLKQSSNVPINALESASFEVGDSLKISKVTFFDAIRNFTFGDDTNDTLFIRQDNPFVNDENVIRNIYESIVNEKINNVDADISIANADEYEMKLNALKGNTEQKTLSGKNLFNLGNTTSSGNAVTYTINGSEIKFNGTTNGNNFIFRDISLGIFSAGTYKYSTQLSSGTLNMNNDEFLVYNGSENYVRRNIYSQPYNATFTLSEDTELFCKIWSNRGTSYTNYVVDFQIEEGSTATPYEEYCGGVPSPNPDYPQNINTVTGRNEVKIQGKNLFLPTLINGDTNISKTNCTVVLSEDEYTLTATGSDMYFGQVLNPNLSYDDYKDRGTLYEVKNATKIHLYLTNSTFTKNYITFYDKNKISLGYRSIASSNGSVDVLANAVYYTVRFGYGSAVSGTSYSTKVMISYDTISEYEPYQSQEYEIDLGKNLFDKDNANIMEATVNSSTKIIESSNQYKMIYIPCKSSTKYAISKIQSNYLSVYSSNSIPDINVTVRSAVNSTDTEKYIYTTSDDAKYLILRYWRNTDTLTEEQIRNTIQIEEGENATSYAPYHEPIELCKIGDYKDYITQNTGKNLFDISENNDYITTNAPQSYLDQTSITFNNGSCVVNATALPSGNGRGDWFYIPLEIGKTYTLNFKTDGSFVNIRLYELNKTTVVYNFPSVSSEIYTFVANQNGIYFRLWTGSTTSTLYYAQLEEGSTATTYEPYGIGEWYLYKKIGRVILDGSEAWALNGQNDTYGQYIYNVVGKANGTLNIYCNRFINEAGALGNYIYGRPNNNRISITIAKSICDYSLTAFSNYLSNNSTYFYYLLETPTATKLTYQPLINQLDAINNQAHTYEGQTYITSSGVETNGDIDINYYINTDFELWSLRNRNYGDFTLDAWDIINYQLENKNYLTLNNNTIKYEMSIMGDVDAKIPTKQQQVTTNVIGGDDKTNLKIIKTNVDQLNATVDIISKQQTATETNISQLQLDVNGINTEVERIENVEINGQNGIVSQLASVQQTVNNISNMFQITGGINLIRNSAFLLTDDLWTFTDSGTNPYHTELGNSYNSALSGDTVSVAEIKLRSIDVKSKSENITDLKTDGTRYTFNFYHKQDNNMTTTIKMYSTEDNTVKAFNDIVITGQQPKTNYSVSFIPTFANYTLEIVVTSTASIGYAYIYDMMLNSGETQSWQPASDEIYSTTLSMSRLGLKVYSVGDGTITLLGSDGLLTYETTDGRTLGRLVSSRTVEGDTTRNITTQALYLTRDITIENPDKWVSTIVTINGSPHKVEYIDRGGQ